MLFSYAPVHEDELKLAVDDEIVMLGEVEEGWWRGRLGAKVHLTLSCLLICS